MNANDIRRQSECAYNQWCTEWRKNSSHHKSFEMKSIEDFRNTGLGKSIVLVANGYSFEKNIETLKKYQNESDIMVCDKSLGHCVKHGIRPDFCLLCDAKVSYEKYMKEYEDELSDTILFSNVCANTKWTKKDKWKDIYFFVNEDILHSEKEFMELSGCKNKIPAGTNVSNAMVVFVTQSNNEGRKNFFGYDKILLLGFDYCWLPLENYYAFNKTGDGKHNYMRHVYAVTTNGEYAYTSTNLLFSAQWLQKYVNSFRLPVIQCSDTTILELPYHGNLENHVKYKYKEDDSAFVKAIIKTRKEMLEKVKKLEKDLDQIGFDHYKSFVSSI